MAARVTIGAAELGALLAALPFELQDQRLSFDFINTLIGTFPSNIVAKLGHAVTGLRRDGDDLGERVPGAVGGDDRQEP